MTISVSLKSAFVALVAAVLLSGCQTTAEAEKKKKVIPGSVLVLGADGPAQSLAADDPAYERAADAIAQALIEQGFTVFDEASLSKSLTLGEERRSEKELMKSARGLKKPKAESAALFTIYTSLRESEASHLLEVRMTARARLVKTGELTGTAETKVQTELSQDCGGTCLEAAVSDTAKEAGRALASRISAQLSGTGYVYRPVLQTRTGYTTRRARSVAPSGGYLDDFQGGRARDIVLVFDGLDDADLRDVEGYLVRFSGYRSHQRAVGPDGYEIAYQSAIGASHLKRNLFRTFDDLGMRARVSQAGETIRVSVLDVPRRHRRTVSDYNW